MEVCSSDTNNTDMSKTDCMDAVKTNGLTYYGAFHNVVQNDLKLKELKRHFPYDWKDWIEKLSSYMKSSGKSYRNHYATICSWAAKEKNHTTAKNHDVPEGKGL